MDRDLKAPRYNVRAVVRATGLTPDTLRVWERRYGLPSPQRTPGGHRLYSQYDVEMLKWLVAREREGLSISRAVGLWRDLQAQGRDPVFSADGLQERAHPATDAGIAGLRERWVRAILNFDEQQAEQTLDEAFALVSADAVLAEVILAGLREIGDDWYAGEASVQQEHLASEIAFRRVQRLIGAAPAPVRPGRLLLHCPPEEAHSLPLLVLTLLLRRRGWDALFLGANVPLLNVEDTVGRVRTDLVVLSAQHSATAMNLLSSAYRLRELEVPVAYGGRIFNDVPALRRRVPGHFLGERLGDAASRVEALMVTGPALVAAEPVPAEYASALEAFRAARAAVERSLNAQLAARAILPAHLAIAHAGTAAAIEAALAFGERDLFVREVEWLRGLLANRGLAEQLLAHYLDAYSSALKAEMGRAAGAIIEWIDAVR